MQEPIGSEYFGISGYPGRRALGVKKLSACKKKDKRSKSAIWTIRLRTVSDHPIRIHTHDLAVGSRRVYVAGV